MDVYKEFPCGCHFEFYRGEIMAEPCSAAHEEFIRVRMTQLAGPPTMEVR